MTDIDRLCTNATHILAMDMVHKAKSGHSGAPLGLAPTAHILWSKYFEFCPNWINSDRFVLSCGNASTLYYSMLHIHSNIISIEECQQFRQYGSKTPGHPEHHVVPEIEVTTGPLGQGFANSVGLAIASQFIASRFNKPNFELFKNMVFFIRW